MRSFGLLACLFSGVVLVAARPYNDGEVIYRQESQLRDPRSFKSFIQSTSKNAVELAGRAMKSFFPGAFPRRDFNEQDLVGLRMNRRAVIEGDKSRAAPYVTYQMPMGNMLSPQFTGAQYYGGYTPFVQYPYYSNMIQNQAQIAKKFMVPAFSPSVNIAQQKPGINLAESLSVVGRKPSRRTRIHKPVTTRDGNQSILKSVSEDTDGFYNAIKNTKKAMITKNKNGGLNLVETIEGNSNKNSAKKSKITKGKKTRKEMERSYKRALRSKGDLEKKLVNYFTNYICGKDC